MKVLVTGAAGFIGFHTAEYLLKRGDTVIGLDNFNDYYNVALKEARAEKLSRYPQFSMQRMDLNERKKINVLFDHEGFDALIHLAAQAGVRYSLTNPYAYIDSNLSGFMNILESCRHHKIKHLVYASSSSVYGANTKMPFSVHHNVDHPISLYAATKKSNELMAHCYSHLYNIPTTGLRFFTVYGPWGRPDMALFIFTKAILEEQPLDVFNHGKMQRDFTYIDDIVTAVVRVMDRPAAPNPDWSSENPDCATSQAPYKVYNIGNHSPIALLSFIQIIEEKIGKKAILNFCDMQAGDVSATYADVDALAKDVDFTPATPIDTGIETFIDWYRSYYNC